MKLNVRYLALLSAALFLASPSAPAASYSMVRSFGALTNVSGFQPLSPLVQDAAGALYGTTSTSEGNLTGSVFKIQPDGTGFTVLMSFSAPVNFTNSNGANPHGGLAISGATLYGTTYNGGSGGSGTIFSIGTDGSNFTVLTNFPATINLANDMGAHPYAGLILSGGTLYGTTQGGGAGRNGTVFSLNTDGTGLTVLKTFPATTSGVNADGAVPDGTLVMSGGMLYGTTLNGGSQGYGTVFAINTAGSIFSNLYNFTGGNDGGNPHAGLALSGGWLFGTASGGGSALSGTVFMLNTSGTVFSNLYTFSGGNDGANPDGGVIISGNTLYGTTYGGGAIGFGTVFSVNTNGMGFTNLYEFDGDGSGGYPLAGLILSGGTLYGATSGATGQEDTAGGNGTLFAVNTNGLGFTNLYTFIYSDGAAPYGGLLAAGNALYGTTYAGGSGGNGTIFQVNPNGTGYSVIKNFSAFGYNPSAFDSTNSDGANPQAGLVLACGTLYGTAYYGGSGGFGAVFAVNTNGLGFTNLYNFTGGSDGANPQGSLVVSGGFLYGTAVNGGSNNNGTVFAIAINGSGITVLKTFSATTSGTNSDGANPHAGLILSGNALYGTALNGGSNGFGTVFAISASTAKFATLYNFTGGSDGANPYAGLVLSGGSLYGTTAYGGSNNNGAVFRVATNGASFMAFKNFPALVQNPSTGLSTNSDGANPHAGLTLVDSTLYGSTANGGGNGYGTAFSVNTNGAAFNTLYAFSSCGGANPYASMLVSGNALYGTALNGGAVGDGAVFSLTPLPPPVPLTIELAGGNVILTWTNPFFSLQSAPAASGIYANIPGATSPYTNAIAGPQQFFRLEDITGQPPSQLVVVYPPMYAGLPGAGQFTLSFSGPTGQNYRIWSSTNFTLPLNGWSVVSSSQFGAGVNTFADTNATNQARSYCITVP